MSLSTFVGASRRPTKFSPPTATGGRNDPPAGVSYGRPRSGQQAVAAAQQIAHPPLVLLVHLDYARKDVDRARITMFVGEPGPLAELLDDDQQVAVGLLDHVAHRR